MIWSVGSRLQGERPGLVAAYLGALPRVPAYLLTHILVSELFAGLVSLQWPVG